MRFYCSVTQNTLSPETASDLVQLKALLQSAVQASTSSAAATRSMAVILLDAVNERVTHLGGTYLTLSFPSKAQFDQLMQVVKERLQQKWVTSSWPDVRRLHRTRNLVQHEGLNLGSQNLAAWSSATISYTRTLVDAVWDVDIDHVVLADAVNDPELKKPLTLAENSLAAGEIEESLRQVEICFKSAWNRWGKQHTSAHSPHFPEFTRNRAFGDRESEVASLGARVNQIEDLLKAQSFSDPGEYVWFLQLIRSNDRRYATADEVQRAIAFCFWWSVRWEAFNDAFDPNRAINWEAAQRRVRTQEEAASVSSIEAREHLTGFLVKFSLENVPTPDSFSEWASLLTTILREQDGRRWRMGNEGSLTVEMDESPETQSVASALNRSLTQVEGELKSRQKKAMEEANRLTLEARKYETDVSESDLSLPQWVERVWLIDSVHSGDRSRLRITPTREVRQFWTAIRSAILKDGRIAACYGSGENIVISPELPPHEIMDVLLNISADISEQLDRKRDSVEAGERRRREVELSFRSAFGV